MARTPEQIVLDFAALWEARDVEGVVQATTPDIVYANHPIPAMVGHEAVRAFVKPNLERATGVEWKFLFIATTADGRTVLTERIDSFIFGDRRVDAPLMGIFELEGDKIARWRDYADIPGFIRDMQAIGQAPGPGVAG